MKTLIYFAAIAWLFTIPTNSYGQIQSIDSITIDQAVHLTLDNYPAIEQARQSQNAATAKMESSRSPYYPDFSLAGSYVRLEPVSTVELQGHTFKFNPNDNYDIHVGFRQTLYDFGKTSTSIKMAQSGQTTAGDYLEMVKFNIAYQIISVFNAILILRQNIAVINEQIEALSQHLDISSKKVEAGTATEFDILTTRVRIASAENEKIDMQSALTNQEIAFRQFTGLSQNTPVYIKGDFAGGQITVQADSLLEIAEKQRLELALARDAEKGADIQKHLMSFGNKPSLALGITSGFKNGYSPNLDQLKANVAAGLQLQFPIFDGWRTKFQSREAEANLLSARAHTNDIRRQVRSDIQQAIAGVKSSLEKIQTSEVQLVQAEEALSMAKTRYEAGVITNLDLLDAQTALSQAKLIRLRSLYDYTISFNILNKATGKKPW